MKLADLDRHPGGNQPLRLALRWLETLTTTPDMVRWSQGQHAAAQQAISEARELLATDVLTLAGRVYPPGTVPTPRDPATPAEGFYDAAGRLRQLCLAPGYLGLHPTDEAAGCTIRTVAVQPLRVVKPAPLDRDESDDLEARAVSHLGRHTCTSCRFLDTCGAHQEPCSRCTVGAGQGGGHTDRWEART